MQRGLAEGGHQVGVGPVVQQQAHQLAADRAHVVGRHHCHHALTCTLGGRAVPPVVAVGQPGGGGGLRGGGHLTQHVNRGGGRSVGSVGGGGVLGLDSSG